MSGHRAAIAIAAGVLGVVLTGLLGNWQLQRAQYKRELQAQWDAAQHALAVPVAATTVADIALRTPIRVRATGRFDHQYSIWLDNRQNQGRSGFYVITPFVTDGTTILVARGWVQRDPGERLRLPRIGQPSGVLTLEGLALGDLPRLLELGRAEETATWPRVWQNLDYAALERASGMTVARFVIQQTSPLDDGLVRDWPPPDLGIDKHRGYALQWFSLAALIAGLTVYFGWRHRRRILIRSPR